MEHDFDRLRCPVCKSIYKNKDIVLLDEINTVIHLKCYSRYKANTLQVVDKGTYRQLINKYDFFEGLR